MSKPVSVLCEEQKSRIRAFLRATNAIKRKRLLKNGLFPIGLKIEAHVASGALVEKVEQPDEELLVSALVEIRKLILNDEPANLLRLHNVIFQKLADDELKKQLGSLNKEYKTLLKNGLNGFSVGIQTGPGESDVDDKSPVDAINIWLHGIYFHDKEDVAEQLSNELANVDVAMRVQFLIGIRITVKAALMYEKFILEHFGDQLQGSYGGTGDQQHPLGGG